VIDRLVELDETRRLAEHESHYVGRYGFDDPADGDPEEFLPGLMEECQERVNEAEEEAAGAVAEEVAKKAATEVYRKAYAKAYNDAYRKRTMRH
jgi:hypothetical protein